MAILRRIPETEALGMGHILLLHDVPGHESGWYSHGSGCPLGGQHTRNATPMCGAGCSGPTPPIYVEETFGGLVLGVVIPDTYHVFGDVVANPSPMRAAVVWDYLKRGLALIPLYDAPVFSDRAEVDAPAELRSMCDEALFWGKITKDKADKVEAIRAGKEKRRQEQEAREAQARVLREIQERELAREARARKIASRLTPGSLVRVTLDPPGFVDAQRRRKPRNRTPSLVGTMGLCTSPGDSLDPYMFLSTRDPAGVTRTMRVHRSLVRVVFDDGTLGDDPS